MTLSQFHHEEPPPSGYPYAEAKLTIRIYRVRADGTRVEVSSCTSDEPIAPSPLSTLTWPACACPRCTAADVA
ncbi:hypothetical protein [Kitasatospora phosalacinea]|uniref:Uncharacterized protein n=1 Tax=Kitasatospora phosalacinea TaxID=2065 RepID=A0ABW6GEP1_9ACTN